MLSDVRVTFADGSQADLVQKAFGVGPYIVAGFAGSIKIGFQMIGHLSRFLHIPANEPPRIWEPDWVAEHWRPYALRIFDNAETAEQSGGAEILLVGASAKTHVSTNPRSISMPRMCIVRFASPDFEPVIQDTPSSVSHIGSGGGVTHYTSIMQKYVEQPGDLLKAEMGALGMWPKILGSSVARIVQDHPVDGISPHLHIWVCKTGQIFIMTNDEKHLPNDGSDPIDFKMPTVARSYRQFVEQCHAIHVGAEGATA